MEQPEHWIRSRFAGFISVIVTTPSHGTISGVSTSNYAYGQELVLKAVADSGYHFTKFTINGVDYTSNPKVIYPITTTTISVTFTAN